MPSRETFLVTAYLGSPAFGPWTFGAPSTSRFAWLPLVGVGRLIIEQDGTVEFTPSWFLRTLWRFGAARPVEIGPSEANAIEIGPSSFRGNTVYSPILGSLLARVLFLREPDYVELQIGVKDRGRLFAVLNERGWHVTRYTKTVWPWQIRSSPKDG